MPAPAPQQIEAFYSAALIGLRFLDAREGKARRFGKVADDSWAALGGELEDRDRLDLLLRDGAVAYPTAFAARAVFAIPGLAEDEPFGPDWPQAPRRFATELLNQARSAPNVEATSLLVDAARSWGVSLTGIDPLAARLTTLGPATRLVVSGARAIAALSLATAARRDLDLADQVVLVATTPAERQLFGLALVLAATRTPARLATPSELSPTLAKRWKLSRVDVALLSHDVHPTAHAAAKAFALELGASDVIEELPGA